MHGLSVLHRGLKRTNIIVFVEHVDQVTVRVGDMGLARAHALSLGNAGELTLSIQTLWYRAPEILFAKTPHDAYTAAVDVWSFGVVVSECVEGP